VTQPRVSLVIGSEGQDGFYLSGLLRSRGDQVVGIGRGGIDLRDRDHVDDLLRDLRPAEIYYLAGVFGSAESAAADPHQDFRRCGEVHVDGWLNFLDVTARRGSGARLFYAASSRVFGRPPHTPQNEMTPHAPLCMYGITKSAGMRLGDFYRGRGVHCSSGILYNHESPRRPANFVSQKIVKAAVEIKLGGRQPLRLGNLSAAVDWGAAEDYVEAMVRILESEQAGDFLVASGEPRTVSQFADTAFSALGLPWRDHVIEDRTLLGAASPPGFALVGDSDKLRRATGWRPRTSFEEMVRLMVQAEMQLRQTAPA